MLNHVLQCRGQCINLASFESCPCLVVVLDCFKDVVAGQLFEVSETTGHFSNVFMDGLLETNGGVAERFLTPKICTLSL